MNYPRVNLLKKNELRYQGAVSSRTILISAVATPIVLIALISGLNLIRYSRLQSALKKSRQTWSQLEPQYKKFQTESKDLTKSKILIGLFDGWEKSRLPFSSLLSEMQSVVPQNIQFSRLSIRNASTVTAYKKPEEMRLACKLVIEGKSHGDMGEQYVFDLVKGLLECERVASSFDSLEPDYMRARKGADGESLREFRLEGGSTGGKK
ncbi:MAG: hypothetical protein OES84_01915 [Kiritimatiellaceae bacterium]|nr:hypothetical protein [Kiritimatiellaceae bacterium]